MWLLQHFQHNECPQSNNRTGLWNPISKLKLQSGNIKFCFICMMTLIQTNHIGLHIGNTRNKFHVNNKETTKKSEDGYPMSWNQHLTIS